jgi:hypothetical protein
MPNELETVPFAVKLADLLAEELRHRIQRVGVDRIRQLQLHLLGWIEIFRSAT